LFSFVPAKPTQSPTKPKLQTVISEEEEDPNRFSLDDLEALAIKSASHGDYLGFDETQLSPQTVRGIPSLAFCLAKILNFSGRKRRLLSHLRRISRQAPPLNHGHQRSLHLFHPKFVNEDAELDRYRSNALPGTATSTPFARVHKEGWLLKLSPNKTLGMRFQKRYFVLRHITRLNHAWLIQSPLTSFCFQRFSAGVLCGACGAWCQISR